MKLKPVPDLLSQAVECEQKAKKLREQAHQTASKCHHDWDKPDGIYTPIYEKGYMIPGDPPGVGGSDHRFDFYVEAKTTPEWTRTCQKCGHIQTTQRIKMTDGVLRKEVPNFGD